VRHFVLLVIGGCATTSPAIVASVSAPEPAPEVPLVWTDGDEDPPGRGCTTDERREAPYGAGVSYHGNRFACRFGPSPEDELKTRVQKSELLRSCLGTALGSGFADVELGVAATGKVTRAEVRTWSGDRSILRCVPVLLALAGQRTGCRWHTTVTIAATLR
jgi:hypothetical protein